MQDLDDFDPFFMLRARGRTRDAQAETVGGDEAAAKQGSAARGLDCPSEEGVRTEMPDGWSPTGMFVFNCSISEGFWWSILIEVSMRAPATGCIAIGIAGCACIVPLSGRTMPICKGCSICIGTTGCIITGCCIGTLTSIGMPGPACGGHVTCIWPAGVLTTKAWPGMTPAGTVICIVCIAIRAHSNISIQLYIISGGATESPTIFTLLIFTL